MCLFQASTCFEQKCSSSGGQNRTIQSLVSSHSVGGRPVHSPLSTCAPDGFCYFQSTLSCINTPTVLSSSHTSYHLPMKMEQIECSETSVYIIQTPRNYPKENIIYLVPKFTGSNPAEAVGFLGRKKNPQHAFLRRGSKAVGPMS